MKVCLAPRLRLWMWMLLPTARGVGTAFLSLDWPRAIEPNTLTLRSRLRMRWGKIPTIKHRSAYMEGPITGIDVQPGRSSIAVSALRRLQKGSSCTVRLRSRIPDAPHHFAPSDTRVRSSAA
jgi:hypothetical protein